MLQVLSTLHEYPCLETCTPLVHYISVCVRLAWKMINQKVPYYLDNDFNLGNYCSFHEFHQINTNIFFVFYMVVSFYPGFLRPDKHERHFQSDRRSDLIKNFIWPALMQNNNCVFKAIVGT